MKKLLIITGLSLLASVSSVWAQSSTNSSSNTDTKNSSSVNKASRANNSQLKGKGVPYTKDKQQSGKSTANRKKGPIPPSSVSSGPDVSDTAQKATTPGSHVSQRERSVGHKDNPKKGSTSAKPTKQQ
ncbi:hypothetical protein [Spirosoma litoris]